MALPNSQQQANRLVIGITGHIGAGKTSVGKHLTEAHRFHYIRYSQVLAEWRAKNSDSKAQLQTVGWEVMAGGMQPELNTRLIAQIPTAGDCAVDGLRDPLDYASLKDAFLSNFYLLYITSSPETRWQRLKKKDPKRFATYDDFRRADSHSVEQQIDSLRVKSFAVLENSGSKRELFSKVDKVLNNIRPGGHK